MNKRLKILLIHPPSNCVEDDRVEPPLGLLYVAASLRERGHEDISLLDMTGCKSEKGIADRILSVPEADAYGISCLCTNYVYAKEVVRTIRKKNPSAHIVLGGPNPSATPSRTLNDSGADAVIAGEGEDAFCRCIDSLATCSPQKGIILGKGRQNIDSYAFPARDLVDISTYSRKLLGKPTVALLSSRGCTNRCIHCNSVVMGGGNGNVRYRSPENVLSEIRLLRDKFSHYRFNDDHFTGHPELERLLRGIKEFDITFRIFAKVEDLEDKVCMLLNEAGCVHVSVGLESLNRQNLAFLGKTKQAGKEDNVKTAKMRGLTIRASFIVGLPYDTDETVQDAFQRACQLGIDEFAVYPLIPYPGTPIARHPEKFGYTIVHTDFTRYIQMGKGGKTCYALRHKNFNQEDVKRWLETATEILKAGGVKHMSESLVAK